MAAISNIRGNFVQLTEIDADWKWSDETELDENGVYITSILYNPDDGANYVVIKEEAASGPGFKLYASVADQPLNFPMYGAKMKPFIDVSASNLDSTNDIITFVLKGR